MNAVNESCVGSTSHPMCITCSDTAVAVRVLELLDDGLASVDVGEGRTETVSVALVHASVGDTVLVHAGEAIAMVDQPEGLMGA